MQLDSIELFHVALPLQQPREIAGRPSATLETVLVALHSGEAVGWGEAAPGNAPTTSGEWAAGVFAVLRDWLAPAVAGASISTAEDLQESLKRFRGNQFAKGAIDMAWWDLKARLEDRPLHQLLAAERPAVEVGPCFDRMESIDVFFDAIGRSFAAGFPRVKLKLRPGWDVEMLRVLRQEFPGETFHVDVEGELGIQHMEILHRLDDFMLTMIEQPLAPDDMVGHAMVQESVRTPICLDEGIASVAQAEMALDLHSCKFVSLKPGRVGGITAAVAIHDVCHENCVACWAGAAPQSTIGARFHIALGAKSNCTYPADFFPSDEVLAQDLAQPLLPHRDPADGVMRIALWPGPGIGAEPDRGVLEKLSLQHVRVG